MGLDGSIRVFAALGILGRPPDLAGSKLLYKSLCGSWRILAGLSWSWQVLAIKYSIMCLIRCTIGRCSQVSVGLDRS